MEEQALFLNVSNHSSGSWEPEQIEAAETLVKRLNGIKDESVEVEILDLSFPAVKTIGDKTYLVELVDTVYKRIVREVTLRRLSKYPKVPVHIMGEQGLTSGVVKEILSKHNPFTTDELDIRPYHSATRRIIKETTEGHKTAIFKFITFREYV